MRKLLMIGTIILALAACTKTEVTPNDGGERLSKATSSHIFEDYGNRF